MSRGLSRLIGYLTIPLILINWPSTNCTFPITDEEYSRLHYKLFRQVFKEIRAEELTDDENENSERADKSTRWRFLSECARWLWPCRRAAIVIIVLSLGIATLEMIQPLVMRYIVDRILLKSDLSTNAKLSQLNITGGIFLSVIIISQLLDMLKNY